MCNKYNLDAVKIYDKFESSEVTGKRDFKKLKSDLEGFYKPYNDESFCKITFVENEKPIVELVDRLEVVKRNIYDNEKTR